MAEAEYHQLVSPNPDYDRYLIHLGGYNVALRMVDLVDTLIAKANERTQRESEPDAERNPYAVSDPYLR